jgi:hypothetical protein
MANVLIVANANRFRADLAQEFESRGVSVTVVGSSGAAEVKREFGSGFDCYVVSDTRCRDSTSYASQLTQEGETVYLVRGQLKAHDIPDILRNFGF